MTPTPADIISDPSISNMLVWVGAGFAAAAGILGLLLRMLLSAYKKNTDIQLKTMCERISVAHEDIVEAKKIIGADVAAIKESQKECDGRTEATASRFEAQIEKQRDRWESFLKDYHVLDATRGQKVDALFRTVDTMRETLKDLRPGLYAKVEEISQRTFAELKLYVRDTIKKEG